MNETRQNYIIDMDQSMRNRVLRNTYWLLALSMIPTILGAWLGVQIDFSFMAGHPAWGFIGFLAIAYGFFYGIEANKNSSLGVILLLAFTFFMGLMLSRLIGFVLHAYTNGTELIMIAFAGTATILGVLATIATVTRKDFSGWGSFLYAGAAVLLVTAFLNIFLQLPAFTLVFSVVVIAIFSGFILYDVQRVVRGGETNYITATLNIYLDVYNIFVSLLRLLSIFAGDRR